ncbi:DUF4249 family protein [Marivirga sp.]|uniref:DUF4249 family protein n=1 Tax=Marivirga sp. TaxID=2018662 RepID=UPI0025D60B9F|nr:DUF4249 family protein [Marivirga sp.]
MRYYLSIFWLIIFSSCTTLVESDFEDYSDYHVVNCILSTDSQIVINVSKSFGLQSKQPDYEGQAEIDMYINDNFHSSLTYQNEGDYIAEVTAKEGVEYRFVVQIPNRESFSIQKKIPVASEILSIDHKENFAIDEEGVSTPALLISLQNDISEIRYHHLKVSQIQIYSFQNDTIVTPIQIKELVDPLLIREGIPILNFSNEGVMNSKIDLTVNYSTGNDLLINEQRKIQLYPLLIELRTTDHDYYELVKSEYLYEQSNLPQLDGNNRPVYEPYYKSYAEGVIGLSVAYSKVIADTLFLENQYQW